MSWSRIHADPIRGTCLVELGLQLRAPISKSDFERSNFSNAANPLSTSPLSTQINGDHSRANSNDSQENHRNQFEDCTDANSKLQPGDLINARGMDAGYLTGQENYFYDCIDKNSVLNPNDIICARGETGIFSSRTNLPSGQEQTSSRASFRQPLSKWKAVLYLPHRQLLFANCRLMILKNLSISTRLASKRFSLLPLRY